MIARVCGPLPWPHGRTWLWATGLVSLVVYGFTLSTGTYPGLSSALVAAAGGLLPESLPSHPLWSLMTQALAHIPVLPLPLRLNLFSACCAALAVSLFGILIHGLIFDAAYEDPGGASQQVLLDGEDDEPFAQAVFRTTPGVAKHNQRAARAAVWGGWGAAMALAFCVPFWSAATRLSFLTSDLLLLLLACQAVWMDHKTGHSRHARVAALICGLGCVESSGFLVWTPLVVILLVANRVQRDQHWEYEIGLALLIAASVAFLDVLLLQWQLGTSSAAQPCSLRGAVGTLVRNHTSGLLHALPRVGWVWIMMLSAGPALMVLLGARRGFAERTPLVVLVHAVLVLVILLGLLGVPLLPIRSTDENGPMPAVAGLVIAGVAGYLIAYWRLLGSPPDAQPDGVISFALCRWLGTAGIVTLIGSVGVSVVLNINEASGRAGRFADRIASDVLGRLDGRAWVISDGVLDNHLLVQAHMRGMPLHVLNVPQGRRPCVIRQLSTWIETDPLFAGRRVRMRNAAELGTAAFVQEWLAEEPVIQAKAVVLGLPELWMRAGFLALPDGIGYRGARNLEEIRNVDLLGGGRLVCTFMDRVLSDGGRRSPLLGRLAGELRRQAGRAENERGILLEDLGHPDEASEAYRAARQLDRENLSAQMNLLALTSTNARSQARASLEAALQRTLARDGRLPSITGLVSRYGSIRQAAVHRMLGQARALQGQPAMACAEMERALALEPALPDTQRDLAEQRHNEGDDARSEQIYLGILGTNSNDIPSLVGVALAAMVRGRVDEARRWIEHARQAGATGASLAVPEAALLATQGQDEHALAALRTLVAGMPDRMEMWAILAQALLARKARTEVEQRVLPAMVHAAGKGDHVLIHLVRARLFRSSSPPDYGATRNALLHALALRPDLACIRDDLLLVDYQSGNTVAIASDAANVLRIQPRHAFANYLLGTILLGRGELALAEDRFRRSLAEQPTVFAMNDLAEALRRQHRLADAIDAARAATRLDPRAANAFDTLGCALLDAGHFDEAASALEQAVAFCATAPRFQLNLIRARLAEGRVDDAHRLVLVLERACPVLSIDERRELGALRNRL